MSAADFNAPIDWDAAYSNRDAVPTTEAILETWPTDAQAFRERVDGRLGIAYGNGAREKLDLFLPAQPPEGLLVFVHGGYWRAFDRSAFSHFAEGALGRNWAVALPSYDLCPTVTIGQIEQQIASSIAKAAEEIDGPIVLSGHSAGGHLVTLTSSTGGSLASGVHERIKRVVSISGVHDLRPLIKTAMNEDFGLTLGDARRFSPVFWEPAFAFDLVAWVGGAELPAFLEQNRVLETAWKGLGVPTHLVEQPNTHHFSVIDDLRDPASRLTRVSTLSD